MATRAQVASTVDNQLARAALRGKERRKRGDIAVRATYEPRGQRLRVELASGVAMLIPVSKIQGLANAKPATIRSVELAGAGFGLYWPSLDLDISVPDLVSRCFGTEAWMSSLARQAGKTRSKAKAAAARVNGRKGGRPRNSRGAHATETLALA